jgi:hypothetical protein
MRAAFAEQAELVETNRLLELIDQFAVAEGRMKWAPNKKLHFEVAVIKAIQTLSQATLDEVIDNLSAMREGKEIGITKPVGGGGDGGEAAAAFGGRQPKNSGASEELDPSQAWAEVVARIPKHKGFLHNLVGSAHFLGVEGRSFVLGFSPEQKSLMETVGNANNRKFLESLMAEVIGKQLSAKLVTKDGLATKRPQTQTSAPPNRAGAAALPIVQEALEMFEGEIKETR